MKKWLLVFLTALTTLSMAGGPSAPRAWAEPLAAEEVGSWPMAGANPQRTSWSPEEVRGELRPLWYKPIEPYIPAKAQVIAANNTLFVPTARGLYALDADTGAIRWVYATEMPLGNSPTYYSGVVYAGGFDHKLHAIDAATGTKLWTFDGAEAGYDTNPLVVNNVVFMGNRDGYMYAVYSHDHPNRGTLAWKFKTGGPIHFSAAYKDGVIYFASNDAYAYALNASTGALVWKSAKLPAGDGFHSWWPVIDGNAVIFSGSRGYRVATPPQIGWDDVDNSTYTKADNYPVPAGVSKPGQVDMSAAMQYLEELPWRRSYYLLDTATGQEITYDFDHDGQPEYAPLMNYGTNSGNRYPAVIGPDGTIYTPNNYSSTRYDNGVSGWRLGTATLRVASTAALTWDEPVADSMGGNVVYWTQCCDRQAGAFDPSTGENWLIFSYNLDSLAPGYDVMYEGHYEANAVSVYGGTNGVYGAHGDQNPPIPYRGKMYMFRSNAVIAWGSGGGAASLPLAETVAVQPQLAPTDTNALKQKLAAEVQKILDAGHLRPGFGANGASSLYSRGRAGDNLTDYWHNPLDTIYALTLALPHLPSQMQEQLRAYLQNEYSDFPPCSYTHIGWRDGAGREAFDLPPEVTADMPNWPPTMWSTYEFDGWTGPDWKWTPHTFYALWKYAQAFGNAKSIFDACRERLWTPPSDDILAWYPSAHNAWIAGYVGYLELEKMAGYPEEQDKRATLNRLLTLRASSFAKDNPWGGPDNHDDSQALSVARNFMYLTPEVGAYLRDNAYDKVLAAFTDYEKTAPYWFVTRFEATYREDIMHHEYDYNALFAAKAFFFNAPREELVKYLDVPAFARGDLFYIQNLVLAIQAPAAGPLPTFADVPFTHPYHDVIEVLYQAGYTAGCNTSPLMYCPDATMNRAESSVFVERGIHTAAYDPPAPTSQVFADMPLDSWAAKWVGGLWNDQYTAGCGTNPLIYCPWQGHTRAEGCVFYLRILRGANYEPAQPTQQTFVDVPLEAWYAKWVKAAYDAGLITACQTTPDLRFCPDGPLTRALAAYMMVQAKGLH